MKIYKIIKIILLITLALPVISLAEEKICKTGSKIGSFDYAKCIEAGGDLGDIFKTGSPGNNRWGYCQARGSECDFPGSKTSEELYSKCSAYANNLTGDAKEQKLKECSELQSPKEEVADCGSLNLSGLVEQEKRSRVLSCLGEKTTSNTAPGAKPSYCGSSSRGYYFEHLDQLDKSYGLDDKPSVPRRERDAAYLEKAKYYSCMGSPCEFYKTMTAKGIEDKILSCYGVEAIKITPPVPKPKIETIKILPVPKVEPIKITPPKKVPPPTTQIDKVVKEKEPKPETGSGIKNDNGTLTPEPETKYTDGVRLSAGSREETERTLAGLNESGGSSVLVIKDPRGREARIGVFKDSEGQIRYTTDGQTFYDSLSLMIAPSARERLSRGYDAVTGIPGAIKDKIFGFLFGTKDKDKDRQMISDVSSSVLAGLNIRGSGRQNAGEIINNIKDKIGEKIIGKIEDAAGGGTTGVNAVKILAQQMSVDRFAQAVRIYLKEREDGRLLKDIIKNPPPELSASQLPSQSDANLLFYGKLEDAYNVVKLRREMK
ncbi:MAG: hypothetical protein HZA94_03215 [Candidatus Vogelbacteria bacterium]|nr:hypothetical protein [Candidatus Vogelbacteria bacterium]